MQNKNVQNPTALCFSCSCYDKAASTAEGGAMHIELGRPSTGLGVESWTGLSNVIYIK